MKNLALTFKRDGFEYELLKQNKFAALYRMRIPGEKRCEYEVWKLRLFTKANPQYNVEVGDIHAPATREWGMYGWTYLNRKEAEDHFGRLTNEMSKPKRVNNQ